MARRSTRARAPYRFLRRRPASSSATFQLGGDFSVAPNFAIGPFFAFTVAEYSHLGGTIDTDLATKSIHSWVMGGVRGVFDIGL